MDQNAGLIVTIYKGNPEPYVDCGWIMSYGPRDLDRAPGATPEATFERLDHGEKSRIGRSLELNGRMVVRVRPHLNTLLTADSTYVLTETLGAETPLGQPAKRAYSFLHVAYIQRAASSGTLCPATARWPAKAMHYVEQTDYGIVPPDGTDMILALATEHLCLRSRGQRSRRRRFSSQPCVRGLPICRQAIPGRASPLATCS